VLAGRTLLMLGALLISSATMGQMTASTIAVDDTGWAYPQNPPRLPNTAPPAPVDPSTRFSVPGSNVTFAPGEVRNFFAIADWRPAEHPPMPTIVANGRKPDVWACGFCHLPDGMGRPENAALAGLPRDYIIEQTHAFRNGERHSSQEGRQPTAIMIRLAKAATEAEIAAAADYFSSIKYRSHVKVVETDMVPKTLTGGDVYYADPKGGTEPLGARIIEMPIEFERHEHRDTITPFIAYAPKGSIKRGAELARNWGGGEQACTTCHGKDLRGNEIGPPIAGRSPTSLARQLHDFKTGARGGGGAELMRTVVEKMRNDDVVALAAYVGSRQP
jgi:cytochrome c553